MGRYSDYLKYKKKQKEENIGIDTTETDNAINNAISGWQDAETMSNTKSAIQSTLDDYATERNKHRYSDYINREKGISSPTSARENVYRSLLESWDSLADDYSQFQNAEAYDSAKYISDMAQANKGLTYEQVKKNLANATEEREYDFWNQYGVNVGYNNLKDYDAEIQAKYGSDDTSYLDKLNKARNIYALDNTFDYYKDYQDAEDYATESTRYDESVDDELYRYANGDESVRDKYKSSSLFGIGNGLMEAVDSMGKKYGDYNIEMMTDEEKQMYTYLYNTDKEKAEEYLSDMKQVWNKRRSDAEGKIIDKAVDTSPAMATVLSAASVVERIAGGLKATAGDVVNAISGEGVNPYSNWHNDLNRSTQIRSSVSENITEATDGAEIFGVNVPSFLYQTGMSIADSALGVAAFGKAYTPIVGTSAYAETYKDALEEGMDKSKAMATSVIAGALEIVTERFSIENLLKITDVKDFKSLVKSAFKQAGIEASEEMASEVGNVLANLVIEGGNNDIAEAYNEYKRRGYGSFDASKNVLVDKLKDVVWAGLGGALSGFGMGGVSSIASYGNNVKTGRTINQREGSANTLVDIANSLDENSAANSLAKTLSGNEMTNAETGALYGALQRDLSAKYNEDAKAYNKSDKAFRKGSHTEAIEILANRIKSLSKGNMSDAEAMSYARKIAKGNSSITNNDSVLAQTYDEWRDEDSDIRQKYEKSERLESLGEDFANKYKTLAETRGKMETVANLNTDLTKDEIAAREKAEYIENSMNIDDEANVDIKNATVDESGDLIVETENGEKTKAEDLPVNENMASVLYDAKIFAKNEAGFDANDFVKNYNNGQDASDYAVGYALARQYGLAGLNAESVLNNEYLNKRLTPTQIKNIYSNAILNKTKVAQAKVDALIKSNKETTKPSKFNDSIIDYSNKTKDGSKVNYNEMTDSQKVEVAILQEMSKKMGINISLFSSQHGNKEGANGWYDSESNSIHIDIFAGDKDGYIEDYMLTTTSHEVTHWMKNKVPTKYAELRENILDALGKSSEYTYNGKLTLDDIISDEIRRLNREHPGEEHTYEDAIDEIVARSCEDMLKGSSSLRREVLDSLTTDTKKAFVNKVKQIIADIRNAIKTVLGNLNSITQEAKALRKLDEDFKNISKMWDDALAESLKVNQAIGDVLGTVTDGNGNFSNDTNVQLSMKTYRDGGREMLVNWLKSKNMDDSIVKEIDAVYQAAQKLTKNPEFTDFSAWSETDVVKDENGDFILSVVVPNGEYKLNIDASTICKKRKVLDKVLGELARSGDLDAQSLSMTDICKITNIIKGQHGFEIACALCFVDSKRYRVNEWADTFTKPWNRMVKSLAKGNKDINIQDFNFSNRDIEMPTTNPLQDIPDDKLDWSYVDRLIKENTNTGKNGRKSKKEIAQWGEALKKNPQLRKTLSSGDLMASLGLDNLKKKNRELYKIVNAHGGSSKPKLSHSEVAYGNEILLQSKFNKEAAEEVGGVRLQSFSDYMPNMVFDYVQMIGDLAAKELPAHAYTKEHYFVEMYGLTGIKINMSAVPKAVVPTHLIGKEDYKNLLGMDYTSRQKSGKWRNLRQYAGLDVSNVKMTKAEFKKQNPNLSGEALNRAYTEYIIENGEYIFEKETFDFDTAVRLRSTKGYDKSCGIIMVGVSEAHIRKALRDGRIDMVIPYHKSSLNPLVAALRKIDLYTDFTKVQNTTHKSTGKKVSPSEFSFDFYADLKNTNDPKKTAQNYIDECEKRGYRPKFYQFVDEPNYYKLLADFRLYDGEGNYAPQKAVEARFPSKAKGDALDFNELMEESLKESQKVASKLDAELSEIMSEIRSVLPIKKKSSESKKQYSSKEDSTGRELSTEQIEYFKDSKARDEEGRLKVMYHGTDNASFTVFNPEYAKDETSLFFTDNNTVAKGYSGTEDIYAPQKPTLKYMQKLLSEAGDSYSSYSIREEDGKYVIDYKNDNTASALTDESIEFDSLEDAYNYYVEEVNPTNASNYSVYLNIENPLTIDAKGNNWDDIPYNNERVSTNELSGIAKEGGYDGVIINNVYDTGLYSSSKEIKPSTIMVAFEPNQIKSINNVNPTEDEDIRYSDKEGIEIETDTTPYIEDDKRLTKVLEKLGNKAKTPSLDKTKAILRSALKKNNIDASRLDLDALSTSLHTVYERIIRRSEESSIKAIKNFLSSYNVVDAFDVDKETIRKEMAKIGRDMGDDNEANVSLASDYVEVYSLNEIATDLAEDLYSAIWNSTVYDATSKVADEETKAIIKKLSKEHREDMANIRKAKNVEMREAIKSLKQEHREEMSALRNAKNTEMAKAVSEKSEMWRGKLHETIEKRDADISKVRNTWRRIYSETLQRRDEEIKGIRRAARERQKERVEKIAKRHEVERVVEETNKLAEMLFKNDAKNYKSVPAILRKPLTAFLQSIEFPTNKMRSRSRNAEKELKAQGIENPVVFKPTRLAETLGKLANVVGRIQNNTIEDGDIQEIQKCYPDFYAGFAEEIEFMRDVANDFAKTVPNGGFDMANMNTEQIKALKNLLVVFRQVITNIDRVMGQKSKQKISDLADVTVEEADKLGNFSTVGEKIRKFINYDNALPYYVFKRLGSSSQMLFEGLMDGFEKQAFKMNNFKDFMWKTYTTEEIHEWTRHINEFNVDGKQFVMTDAQLMSLYCLNKREQAKKHLYGDGIKVGTIEKSTDKNTKHKKYSPSDVIKLKPEDVEQMTSKLSDRQKKVADELQKYMSTTLAHMGNEITMQRWGIEGFKEENYFPITSDPDFLSRDMTKEQESNLYALLNMSFTKALQDKATNDIMVFDIFDVVTNHAADMIKYNTLALPVLDVVRWFTYKDTKGDGRKISTRHSISKAFGNAANQYIRTFLNDLNGSVTNEDRGTEISRFIVRNTKTAAVAGNIRVALLQYTSFFRAGAVMDAKYLKEGLKMGHPKESHKRAIKWSGVALWKDMGKFYDTNISRGLLEIVKNDESTLDKIKDAGMKGAEIGDAYTWGILFNACMCEVKDKTNLKEGTDEFYKAAANRFREVIFTTQVFDSAMSRTQMMRSKSGWSQMLTNFMSEPAIAFNMLMDVFSEWSKDVRIIKPSMEGKTDAEKTRNAIRKTFHKHGKDFSRKFMAYTVTNLAAAIVETMVDVFRRKDEDEAIHESFGKDFFKEFVENLLADMDVAQKIPYVKDIISIFQGYSSGRIDTQFWSNLVKMFTQYKKVLEGDGNAYKTVYQTAVAISSITGIPIGNLMRDGVAMWDALMSEVYPSLQIKQ